MHIEAYLKYLKFEKRYSSHTICAYTNDLQQFADFILIHSENKKISPDKADFRLIRKWIIFLYNNKQSTRTIKRKISGLKKYYKYLIQNQIIDSDPTNKISIPKITIKPTEVKLKVGGHL